MPGKTIQSILEDEKLFINAFEHAAIGMALVSPGGQWLMVNQALCALFGYEEKELLSLTFQDITHPDDLESDLQHIDGLLTGKNNSYQKEKRYLRKDGRVIHAQLNVSVVTQSDGTPHFLISQIQDITERKNLENELVRQAKEDTLTGVCNRRCFYELSAREISRAARYDEPAVLLMLDIDHFKQINDCFGHALGDEALKAMTATCTAILRPFDLFGRIGGEEFTILLIKTDLAKGQRIAERLRKAVEKLILPTADGRLRFTVSIGGVAFRGNHRSIEERIKQADEALYEAKNAGRNTVRISTDIACAEKARIRHHSFVRLDWHDSFQSGHALLDRQHRQLFGLGNELLAHITTSGINATILGLIDRLVKDISKHFKTEEGIIQSAGYPLTDRHTAIHAELLEKAKSLAQKMHNGRLDIPEVVHFLTINVVCDHMLQEDQKFFPYLNPKDAAVIKAIADPA